MFVLVWGVGPSSASRAWVDPDTTYVERLDGIHTVHVVPGRSGLGFEGRLEVQLPWTLVGFEASFPPPAITSDQVDVWVSGERLRCRVGSEVESRQLRVIVDRFPVSIAGDDTVSIGFRFPWIPSRPGRYPVRVLIDRGYGKTRPVPSGVVVVRPALRLALPSRVAPGATVPIRIHAPGSDGDALPVEFRLENGPVRILEGVEGAPVRGHFDAPDEPGFYWAEARLVGEPDVAPVAAVLRVRETGDSLGLWWADLHGHSALSDGFGSPEGYYRHARNIALLDAAALTDHDVMLDGEEWGRVGVLADSMESLVGFSALPGYEWSSRFGDRTVLLPRAGIDVLGRSDPAGDHAFELQAWAKTTGAVLLLQHPASGFRSVDWRFHDPGVEPVCEVYSMHGFAFSDTSANPLTSRVPWTARAASPRLAMGTPGRSYLTGMETDPALGVIAAGDIHSARPGDLGLVAVFAGSANRGVILDALRARRVYGTTGARIVLEFEVNGVGMGGRLVQDGPVEARVRSAGPVALDHVLILRDGLPVFRQNAHGSKLVAKWSSDIVHDRTRAYQAVVVDVNGDRAWSSPIRVEPAANGSSEEEEEADPESGGETGSPSWTQVLDLDDPPARVVLDLPDASRVRFSLFGTCGFRGVLGSGPALDDDDLALSVDGVMGPRGEDRIDGLVSLGQPDTLQFERHLASGRHHIRVMRDGAPVAVHLRAWTAPGAKAVPAPPDPGDGTRRPLGPDLLSGGLVGLENGVVVTRHPVAPGVVLLAVQWTRDLDFTSGFSEEQRWVETEINLSAGSYVVRDRGFEEDRDALTDDGRGRIRAVARADRESGLEVLVFGATVDATIEVRSGGYWVRGHVAGEEHLLRGVRVPLTGRSRPVRFAGLSSSSHARAARSAFAVPVFPDTSVLIEYWAQSARPALRIQRLLALMERRPHDSVLLGHLAQVYRDTEEWAAAADAFARARRLDGATPERLTVEAEMLRRAGDTKGATRRIEEALAADAENARALREAARLYLDSLGDPSVALIHIDRLIANEPEVAWGHLMRARALHASGRIDEGRLSARTARDLDPDGAVGKRAERLLARPPL